MYKKVQGPSDTTEILKKMVPEKSLSQYTSDGWKMSPEDPVMSYAPPEWICNRSDSGILILDDWTRAGVNFIQAIMELVDRGEYISWKLPKDWHIVLTSNPDDGRFIVNATDEAHDTRFLTMNVKYDEKVWATWAEKNGVASHFINFMLLHPEVVKGVKHEGEEAESLNSNPRSWTKFFYSLGDIKDYKSKDALSIIEEVGQMAVGEDLTAMFISFIHNDMHLILDPEWIIKHTNTDEVIKGLETAIGIGNEYKADMASIQALRFINYLLLYARKNPIKDPIIDRIFEILKREIFAPDISLMIFQRLYSKERTKFLPMLSRPEFTKYMTLTV